MWREENRIERIWLRKKKRRGAGEEERERERELEKSRFLFSPKPEIVLFGRLVIFGLGRPTLWCTGFVY